MVSKTPKRTPARSIKGSRRRQNHSPETNSCSPPKLVVNLNKTIHSCKKRLAKIFSKLVRINKTPKINSRYKGYKSLKRIQERDVRCYEGDIKQNRVFPGEKLCRTLFTNEKLPPLISRKVKGTIVLDLDETLVHSSPDPPPEKFDFVVRPVIDGQRLNFYVLKRPGVQDFLEELAKNFEIVVFTAGLREYASLVLDTIDRKKLVSHRLYRDSCKQIDGKYVKDLSELGRDLRKIVIVDDNPGCYTFQPDNALPIRPFVDDLGDKELWNLSKFFSGCQDFNDMREAVKIFVAVNGLEQLKLQRN